MNRSCLSSVRGASSPVVMVTPPPPLTYQHAQGPALSNVLSAIVYSLGLLLPSGSRPTLLLPVLCLSLFSGVCLFCRQTVTVVAMDSYNYRFRNLSYDKVTCWFIAWARYLTPVPFIDFVNFSPSLLSAIYDNKLRILN